MTTWKLKRTAQCTHCPWRKGANPYDIPNGYSLERHRAFIATLADPDARTIERERQVMACHETEDAHCIGWLNHQLGRGNNLWLRLRMMTCGNAHRLRLRGEQHACFEDTLPAALEK